MSGARHADTQPPEVVVLAEIRRGAGGRRGRFIPLRCVREALAAAGAGDPARRT